MLTKQDMQQLEEKFVTKKEFKDGIDQVIEAVSAVGETILSEVKKDINIHNDILNNHERRLEKLEDKVNLPA